MQQVLRYNDTLFFIYLVKASFYVIEWSFAFFDRLIFQKRFLGEFAIACQCGVDCTVVGVLTVLSRMC